MKVHCLGGGPAGLYLGILLRKARPDFEVTVFERNRPDDTFGWGVVFSDETLGNLEESDPESYGAITRDFAYWNAIDTHVGDRVIRSGGHGFCGISRKRLLQILQERARRLGVEMRFSTEVNDPAALREGADLLVAGDGVNSLCRRVWADAFRPSIELGKNRFIWLGTEQKFEAFTFAFRDNEDGLFQVHAYQFDARTSTFIVECDEATWRNARLDRASEAESISYCERVFSPDLGGKPLLPNRSAWIQFTTVKNERWHHDNVVLMGDAAHTAHFSVGSGTKMAMEDSMALAGALVKHARMEDALTAYEAERRPQVERIQTAAAQSQDWFERTRTHVRHRAERLVFSLLTRTRKLGRDNLARRDPAYIASVDRFFADEQGSPPDVPTMLSPVVIAGLPLKNRVITATRCVGAATGGLPGEPHRAALVGRAGSGAALVLTETVAVSADGRMTAGCAGLYADAHEAAWKDLVAAVRALGTRIGIQLGHAGRRSTVAEPPLAPSAVPWGPGLGAPRAMTAADMERVREDFVRAARRAAAAGFDLLEIHAAHGGLLSSFLSPLANRRTDRHGGSLVAARAAFLLEIVDAVRAAWPDQPLAVRLSANEWIAGGIEPDHAVDVAALLRQHGVDLVAVASGGGSPDARPVHGRAYLTGPADRIRNEAGIPVLVGGGVTTADQASTLVLAGRADLVGLLRVLDDDPGFVRGVIGGSTRSVDPPGR